MTVFNEGRHTAEFMISEAVPFRAREVVTISEGESLAAGTVLKADGNEYVALSLDGEGDLDGTAAGILWAAVDATDGAVEATMIARDVEVHGDKLVWPDDISSGDKDTAIGQLESLGIIVR